MTLTKGDVCFGVFTHIHITINLLHRNGCQVIKHQKKKTDDIKFGHKMNYKVICGPPAQWASSPSLDAALGINTALNDKDHYYYYPFNGLVLNNSRPNQ